MNMIVDICLQGLVHITETSHYRQNEGFSPLLARKYLKRDPSGNIPPALN